MKGKMIDKLNGRSRAVLDALREGRHAPVLPSPAPSPAPETRPCVICESTLTGRARQALSASSHLLNRLLHRASGPSESRHRTRFSGADVAHVAKRPQTPPGESGERAGPADGGTDGLGRSPSVDSSGRGR